ncbi:type IV pilus modification protein PilV [Halomonas sp. LBP4]|uniref:type IV pilus modification protein PilV n=1 Tax=Halomonas sp. LBP4 TaxID=2044917 RepID=UPI000D7695A5|nr:type IV pilus modification protein PilV [Halomonas sp. LBP4]PXX94912.1 type IV pilus modification protein PilV [Halomonas sp. LBP4]
MPSPNKRREQRGFTLLEVLIAVLVLSIGLLGIAAMQLKAMKSVQVSYQRSIASLAARDAVERLWVEMGSASNFCPSDTSSPTLSAIASEWITHWSDKLPDMQNSKIEEDPGGTGVKCEYQVTVDWSDDRFLSYGTTDTENVSLLSYTFQLPGREP